MDTCTQCHDSIYDLNYIAGGWKCQELFLAKVFWDVKNPISNKKE